MKRDNLVTIRRIVFAALLGAGLFGVGLALLHWRVNPARLTDDAILAGMLAAAFAAALPVTLFEILVRRRASREIEAGHDPHGPLGIRTEAETDFS